MHKHQLIELHSFYMCLCMFLKLWLFVVSLCLYVYSRISGCCWDCWTCCEWVFFNLSESWSTVRFLIWQGMSCFSHVLVLFFVFNAFLCCYVWYVFISLSFYFSMALMDYPLLKLPCTQKFHLRPRLNETFWGRSRKVTSRSLVVVGSSQMFHGCKKSGKKYGKKHWEMLSQWGFWNIQLFYVEYLRRS